MSNESDELTRLRAENERLIALLESHDIDWRHAPAPTTPSASPPEPPGLSTAEKVALFRRLFRGRTDVHPVRWESATTGKSGYASACANEWRPGICEKPRIKCADCSNRSLIPVSDAVIYSHFAGEKTVGVYPLLPDDTCYFLAVDFDKAEWREDAKAFVQSCRELNVPVALEVSRSGNGAHAWIFFTTAMPARDARRLGTAIISHTCSRTRQLSLTSYDRLFPNQDTMPKGGFGNLIALPLQKKPREADHSVFVDDDLSAYPDQWTFLATIESMSPQDSEPAILRATGPMHPLDVTFIDEEDLVTPWKRKAPDKTTLPGPLPEALTITLANLVYFEKAQLTQPLTNRLIRLAAFQNPEFYRAQAMRLSVWDKPRVIGCAENFPQHLGLPRGCLDAAQELLRSNGIRCDIHDERINGTPFDVEFAGTLRPDQEDAVVAMLPHDVGVLCAATAFGKTVTGAAIIARRRVNTLILVHRTELLRQWQERLNAFLGTGKGVVGIIGGGRRKPTGKIDIAVMQSLSRKAEVDPLVEDYGQVIVDECHHVGAVSFDAILKRVKARYVLGLTATPIRRDGQQPIIFMQCGPIRHAAAPPASAPHDLEVIPRILSQPTPIPEGTGIQDIFRTLAEGQERTAAIADEAKCAVEDGRKVLVLTERTDHLENIKRSLEENNLEPFVLHGRMSKKQRANLISEIDELPPDSPRILLATGRLVGEGFDHPPLDTLLLAMPGVLERHIATVRWPLASRARYQDRRSDHRFRRYRPSRIAPNVGETPTRLPRDGLPYCGTLGIGKGVTIVR